MKVLDIQVGEVSALNPTRSKINNMGFKLGRERGLQASNGEVKSKLRFKREEPSIPGTPIIRVPLEEGVLGEANMDGSIYISDQLVPGGEEETQVIVHEMRHATDIKLGKLKYSDNDVEYDGIIYPRQTIDGADMILYNGEWVEAGGTKFPWENDANNGNH